MNRKQAVWLRMAALGCLLCWVSAGQAQVVYDNFNDKAAGDLRGQGGGGGWENVWAGSVSGGTGTIDISTGDLTAPAETHFALVQSGTPQSIQGTSSSIRGDSRQVALAAPLEGSVWFSFLVRNDSDGSRGGIYFNDPQGVGDYTPSDPRITTSGHQLKVLVTQNGGQDSVLDNIFVTGRTALVLGRVDFNAAAGNERLRVWIDPDVAALAEPLVDNASGDFGDRIDLVGVMDYYSGSSPGATIDMLTLSDNAWAYMDVTGVSPAYDLAVSQIPSGDQAQVTLTWKTARDPLNPIQDDSAVLKHLLYADFYNGPTDPNLVLLASLEPEQESFLVDLPLDGAYRFRVDELRAKPGTVLMEESPDDPNAFVVASETFTFETLKSLPQVLSDPNNALVFAGEDAVFELIATGGINPITAYQWYRTGDGASDRLLGAGDPNYAGVQTNRLIVLAADEADEGGYYCRATNAGGSTNSQPATLALKKMLARWTLDADDFAGGRYLDQSAAGHDAVVTGTPTFVAGPDGDPDGAVAIDGVSAAGSANGGTWSALASNRRMTLSLWVDWYGPSGTGVHQRPIAKRDIDWNTAAWNLGNDGAFPDSSNCVFNNYNGSGTFADEPLVDDGDRTTFQHYVFVLVEEGPCRLYLNGTLEQTGGGWPTYAPGAASPINIGCGKSDSTMLFHGALSDIRIYNYDLSAAEVARLYYDVTGQGQCVDRPAADIDGDCAVTLSDVKALLDHWLDSGMSQP